MLDKLEEILIRRNKMSTSKYWIREYFEICTLSGNLEAFKILVSYSEDIGFLCKSFTIEEFLLEDKNPILIGKQDIKFIVKDSDTIILLWLLKEDRISENIINYAYIIAVKYNKKI